MSNHLVVLYLFLWKCFIVESYVVQIGPILPSSISFSFFFPRLSPKKVSEDNDHAKAPNLTNHHSWQLLPQKCGLNYPSDRIFGGDDASLGEYPWMVLVGKMNISGDIVFTCAGSLISEWFAITAQHCIESAHSFGRSVARLGENYLGTDTDCDENVCAPKPILKSIEFFLRVNEYEDVRFRNDIALAKFETRVEFNDFIRPICLPTAKMIRYPFRIVKTGDMVEVAGWGRIDGMLKTKTLQHVELPIVSMNTCKKIFRGISLDESQFCVGEGDMKDSCAGDSGGPMMKIISSDQGPPRYYLFGVVSFGSSDCGISPAVYVNIMHHMKWILDNMDPAMATAPKSCCK